MARLPEEAETLDVREDARVKGQATLRDKRMQFGDSYTNDWQMLDLIARDPKSCPKSQILRILDGLPDDGYGDSARDRKILRRLSQLQKSVVVVAATGRSPKRFDSAIIARIKSLKDVWTKRLQDGTMSGHMERKRSTVSGEQPQESKQGVSGAGGPNASIQSATDEQRQGIDSLLGRSQHGYVIRITKRTDQEQAIDAMFGVPFARARISDDSFLVLDAHLDALRARGIPFEDVSGPVEDNV